VHELATNAAKYGALSTPDGRLKITWDLQPSSLVIVWNESGGPAVSRPNLQGFGTKLIEASIQGQLNGGVGYNWQPSGLRCELEIPRQGQVEPPLGKNRAVGKSGAELQNMAGGDVMVVEDEALVAMMMGDIVEQLGFSVFGPFNDLSTALQAAGTKDFTAAVLDINLAGEVVYPLADILSQRGVPFIFVTGYNSEHIDERFSNIPVLQKPVQIADLKGAFRSQGLSREAA
jgi:CheY-like chemotaxis protein